LSTRILLSEATKDMRVRIDVKAVSFLAAVENANTDLVHLGSVADVREMGSCEKPEGPFRYDEISSVDAYGLGEAYLIEEDAVEPGSEEARVLAKVEQGDICKPTVGSVLLPKVRPHLGKAVLIDKTREEYFTTAFLEARPRGISSELLYCLLRHPFMTWQMERISRVGKGYPTIGPFELSRSVKIPSSLVDRAGAVEERIRNDVAALHGKLQRVRPESEIVSSIFGEALGLDESQANGGKRSRFELLRSDLAGGFDVRVSAHFVGPKRQELLKLLERVGTVKMVRLCCERILLGVSPEISDSETGFYYLGPQAMTKERLNPEKLAWVPESFFEQNEARSGVRKGDVFLRRSGASLGKVLYYEDEIPCIFSDFLMRLRFKNELVGRYAAYWMRSKMFQDILGRTAVIGKGLRNVYPYQVELMPVPFPDDTRRDLTGSIEQELEANERLRQEAEQDSGTIDGYLSEELGLQGVWV